MAKGSGESKLALVGALTLALAVAGVLLVKEPLRSSRPIGTGLEMKHTTGEQLVRARLWEDPLEAVQRGVKEKNDAASAKGKGPATTLLPGMKSEIEIIDRVRLIREAIEGRIENHQRITVLLVTTVGGPYSESSESRIRDRYALGAGLGVACYVPEDEGHLSFVEWNVQGSVSALPYEWYRERKTRSCDTRSERADSVLIIWLPDDAFSRGFFATMTSLSQALMCEEESEKSRRGQCKLTKDKRLMVNLNQTWQKHVTFKILGPRSSSSFRSLLEEAGEYRDIGEGVAVWPNADGKIDLYSPWTTAMKGLLAYGLTDDTTEGGACRDYEDCEKDYHQRLAKTGIRLAYDIGSDDALFETLIEELERRQVRLGWDAVILIGEWDSFYGRALPIEFRAAACHKISKLSESELTEIQVPASIKSWCPTVQAAINLQIQRPADYESLTLNVFRYSYLSGLDGEVPGGEKVKAGRSDKLGTNAMGKDARVELAQTERPEGTGQLDYVRALAARIRAEGEGARAIGIMGTDPYDALLILKALRPQFPNAIFFTTDLDARHLHATEYKWTRNLVIASHFGVQLEGGIQRDIPPFRSSYQTSTFFAVLRAVDHAACAASGTQKQGLPSCQEGYRVSLSPEGWVYSAALQPRLFEVGRDGAVDLSVVKVEGARSIYAPRPDLRHVDQVELKTGTTPETSAVFALVGIGLLIGALVVWTQQRCWLWACRNSRLLVVLAAITVVTAVIGLALDGPATLMAHHDEGEPFSWTTGVSVWPTELLRFVVIVLCLIFLTKASRDLAVNGDRLGEEFSFTWDRGRKTELGPASFWTNLRRVCHPTMRMPGMTVDQAWAWYREAGTSAQRALRILIMFALYAAVMVPLQTWVLDEEFIRPCRGAFSCHVDQVMTLCSIVLVVVLNLFVFDAVMLCRRWIGWLGKTAGNWPDQLQRKFASDYGMDKDPRAGFEKLEGLACVELIAQRTHVVNRLIRYPFIALLILIVARNNYFDLWSIPLVLVITWTVNGVMALGGSFLLYQSADKAKQAVLSALNKQLLQTMGLGKDQEHRVKQVQFLVEEIESNHQGAFVPLYQQPVIESSLYGLVALLQYLYMG